MMGVAGQFPSWVLTMGWWWHQEHWGLILLVSQGHVCLMSEGEGRDGVGQLLGHTVIPPLVPLHLWWMSSNLTQNYYKTETINIPSPDQSKEKQTGCSCPPCSKCQSHHHLHQKGLWESQPLSAIQHRKWTEVKQKLETSNLDLHLLAEWIVDPSNWPENRSKLSVQQSKWKHGYICF